MYVLYVLPRRWLSRQLGRLMHICWPRPIAKILLRGFAELYQIAVEEAEHPLSYYRSIGEFFVRRLKPGLRPVADAILVHPVDAKIRQAEFIAAGQLIQAKGKSFSLADFLASEEAAQSLQNPFFITYYLCPTDYHRVHCPADAEVLSVHYVPGDLWPVNDWSLQRIDRLFAINERLIVELAIAGKRAFLVMVGATNVGKMSLSFDESIVSNQEQRGLARRKTYEQCKLAKGEELGCFHMGSTVVMVYEADFAGDLGSLAGKSARLGEALF